MTLAATSSSRAVTAASNIGFWAGFAANILWASSFLGAQYTLNTWRPLTAGTLRVALATVFIFVGIKLLGRRIEKPRTIKGWVAVFSVSLAGFGVLYPWILNGLTMIPSGLSACIMLTGPLFIILFGALLLRESLELRKIVALVIGFAGAFVLVARRGGLEIGGEQFYLGCLLTFAASACFSLSAVLSRIASRFLDPFSITFWAMLMAAAMMLPMALAIERPGWNALIETPDRSAWLAIFYLALVCSAFCYFIWYFALSRASAKELAATMYLKTPTAVLLGVALASEALTTTIAVGTAIIMFGVWISQSAALGSVRHSPAKP